MSPTSLLDRLEHRQGDQDAQDGQARRGVEGEGEGAEGVLCLPRDDAAQDGADAVGEEDEAVVLRVVLHAEEDRRRRRRDGQPAAEHEPEADEAQRVEHHAAGTRRQHAQRADQDENEGDERRDLGESLSVSTPKIGRPDSVEDGEDADERCRRGRVDLDDLLGNGGGDADGHEPRERADDVAQEQPQKVEVFAISPMLRSRRWQRPLRAASIRRGASRPWGTCRE